MFELSIEITFDRLPDQSIDRRRFDGNFLVYPRSPRSMDVSFRRRRRRFVRHGEKISRQQRQKRARSTVLPSRHGPERGSKRSTRSFVRSRSPRRLGCGEPFAVSLVWFASARQSAGCRGNVGCVFQLDGSTRTFCLCSVLSAFGRLEKMCFKSFLRFASCVGEKIEKERGERRKALPRSAMKA